MTNGLVYLFCGIGFAERIALAWWTMRKHWSGPVTCFVADDCRSIALPLAAEFRVDLQEAPAAPPVRHSAYQLKALLPVLAPYDRNLFIDGDTMVAGGLQEIFDHPEPLVVTQFSTWVSCGRIMRGRILRMSGRSPAIDAMAERAAARQDPAVNTGVFRWDRGNGDLEQWQAITESCAGQHMTDELAMQLLLPSLAEGRARVVDDRWNCSPIYGVHKEDVRVWHCHGGKHLRKEQGKAIWWPAFLECLEANPGGLKDWAGKHDKWVREELVKHAP